MLEWLRLVDSLLSILLVFALIAGQAYLIKHQIQQLREELSELKRQLENLRGLLEDEKEKRHETEKKQAILYAQRSELAYEISRMEAQWKELKDDIKSFILEAVKHVRETG